MQLYDKVKVIKNKKEYNNNNVFAGESGIIWEPEIIDNTFYVMFNNNSDEEFYKFCNINIEDLEFVEKGFGDDETILQELRGNNPKWWCKVENGFIVNLLGENKNKKPYDYNS